MDNNKIKYFDDLYTMSIFNLHDKQKIRIERKLRLIEK